MTILVLAIAIIAMIYALTERHARIRVEELCNQRENRLSDQLFQRERELAQTQERLDVQRRHSAWMQKAQAREAQAREDGELFVQLEALRRQGRIGQA